MRFLQLTVFLLALSVPLRAQFGAAGFYNSNNGYTKLGGSKVALSEANGYEAALHYWFRLPKKRVEFQPTIYYAGTSDGGRRSEYGFQFKTNIYPFDFGTDCECPTFGKQGPQLQKGLFVQLSPGVANHHFASFGAVEAGDKVAFTIGGGIGLDFGISNALTLTPLVSIRHTLTDYQDLDFTDDRGTPIPDATVRLTTVQFGLQATIRLDKKHY